MSVIHFLNVLEGDCNIIQHDSGHVTVIDISNGYNQNFTEAENAVLLSEARKTRLQRTLVPADKVNYHQKEDPDNPIAYLHNLNVTTIFRFIITHPDMDHLDGIQDLYIDFQVINTWDTDNNVQKEGDAYFGGYNKEDWDFYTELRAGKTKTKRLTLFDGFVGDFYAQDDITILCPSKKLVDNANLENGDIHDASYVLLYTPPKKGGGKWKILFAGDSHDHSWEYILEHYGEEVSDIDILFAPHHGRASNRDFGFLKTLKPTVTLLGNASSKHLAYSNYPKTRITNNQAGFVILDVDEDRINIYVKNKEFAHFYHNKHFSSDAKFSAKFNAYLLGSLKA